MLSARPRKKDLPLESNIGTKCGCPAVLESSVLRLSDCDFGHGHGLKNDSLVAAFAVAVFSTLNFRSKVFRCRPLSIILSLVFVFVVVLF